MIATSNGSYPKIFDRPKPARLRKAIADFEQGKITRDDLSRIEQTLDLLLGDMQPLMAKLARLEQVPDLARELLDVALATDDVCCRYRVSAFRPFFDAAGHRLELYPCPSGWFGGVRLPRDLPPLVDHVFLDLVGVLDDRGEGRDRRDVECPPLLHEPRGLRRYCRRHRPGHRRTL